MFDIIVGIIIVLSTTFNIHLQQNSLDIFLLQFCAGIIITVGLFTKPVREICFKKFVFIPIAMCIFQFFFFFHPEALGPIFQYFNHYLIAIICIYIIVTRLKNTDTIVISLLVMLAIQTIFVFLQNYAYRANIPYLMKALDYVILPGLDANGLISDLNLGGLLGSIPRLTFLYIIVLPVLLRYGIIIYSIISLSVGFMFCFGLSDPQVGVLLTTIILIATHFFFKSPNKIITGGIFFISSVVFIIIVSLFNNTIHTSFMTRYDIWTNWFADFTSGKLGILTGHGIDVFKIGLERTHNRDYSIINSYLFLISGFGISGIYFIIRIFYLWIRNFNNHYTDYILISLFILCFIEYPLEVKRFWIPISSIVALYLILKGKNNGKKFSRNDVSIL